MSDALYWSLGLLAAVLLIVFLLRCRGAGARALFEGVENGDRLAVERLLARNPRLANARKRYGETPLHRAGKHNQRGVADLLLAAGADVNAEAIGHMT